MITAGIMLLIGVLLSAFFSGSETGFYRVNRVRLVLDSRGGDLIARGLLYLTNNPSLFVATTLIGNNLANYVTSLAIVLITQEFFAPEAHVAELVAPIALSPLLFVYGELLPKRLYYHAPYRLLRRGGQLLLM
jgi:Mg2+/Co2+ transporter CorB